MEYRYVVYMKDHGMNKKSCVAYYELSVCEELIRKKLVKYYKPKKRGE